MIKEIEKIALGAFVNMLKNDSGCDDNHFWQKTSIMYEGRQKTLYICGTVHSKYQDGSYIAVVNPQVDLLAKLKPGVAYTRPIMKEFATGKCDMLIYCQVTGGQTIKSQIINKYKATKFFPVIETLLPWALM